MLVKWESAISSGMRDEGGGRREEGGGMRASLASIFPARAVR